MKNINKAKGIANRQKARIARLANANKTILSLFDFTGNWSKPYREAGYHVMQIDIKKGQDVFEVMAKVMADQVQAREEGFEWRVHGILAAPPCDDFASSGARWWQEKEKLPSKYRDRGTFEFKNTVEHSVAMVLATLEIVEQLKPAFWAIENPVGRIRSLVPEIGAPWFFNPCDFGDPYTKKTAIYGKFNRPKITNPVLPIEGSKMHRMSSTKKTERSETPMGFAYAFFKANP
jgi:hypothetical protein